MEAKLGVRWATLCPCPRVPCLPPVLGGLWGVLCHKLHKDFSQTTIQGFLSCRVGRRRQPALPRILLWTNYRWWGAGGTLVASAGFWVPLVPSQDLGADPTEGSWAKPGTFLRSQDSFLCSNWLWAGASVGRSPGSAPRKPYPSTVVWAAQGRRVPLLSPQRGQHCALAPPLLLC